MGALKGMNPESAFLENLPLIDRICGALARRWLLQPADADDFAANVKLRLVADDYAVLRKFEGRSSLPTYLSVVITNLFRDERVHRWGRWRASVEARRLGPLAVQLECLLYRDGYTLAQAISRLRSGGYFELQDREAVRIAQRLPVRTRVREIAAAELEREPDRSSADDPLLNSERTEALEEAHAVLEQAVRSLTPQDALILRMRFYDAMSVADIARALNLEQKPLYRRLDRLFASLRAQLHAAGLNRERIQALLEDN